MIKLVIFDLDGCFTDGSLHQNILNAKDTYALKKLIKANIPTAIISKTRDNITDKFLRERITYIYTNVDDKIETCDKLLSDLKLSYNDVAYIGDDEPDIKLLQKVKLSGCPKDAIGLVKNISKFISYKNGGKGAIRDFVDFILSYNNKLSKKIVPVIGVRSGSVRCKNKNIRSFGLSQNLLDKKLEILSGLEEIEKIIVSSDSNDYLEIAKKYPKVSIDKRNEYYSSSDLNGTELFKYLGKLINDDEIFMYSPVVSPFLTKKDYLAIIEQWENCFYEDSLATFHSLKEFMWDYNSPINYEHDNPPRSQDLPESLIPTLGICLIEKNKLLEYNNVIGKNPKIIKLDKVQAIDIDDNYDFAIAKLLNENGINDMNSLELYLDKSKPTLLDCSIRDGGYRNDWNFTDKEVIDIYSAISNANIPYFEIGFRSTKIPNKGKWFYSTDSDIQEIKKSYHGNTPAKIAVMIKYGEYDLFDITENSPIDMYRVLIKSKDYNSKHNSFIVETIKKINSLGKEVALNIPCGHNLDPELKVLFSELKNNNCHVDVFYLADTFGSMDELTIIESFNYLEELLSDFAENPVFGFHAHNNNGNALYKTIQGYRKSHRIKFIDSCILGMGRGIGNLKTEDVIYELNKEFKTKYNTDKIYQFIFDNYENERDVILYRLSGEYKVHPNYVNDILNKNLDYQSSLNMIKELSSQKSNSYTKLN